MAPYQGIDFMLLQVENKPARKNPRPVDVQRALSMLRSYGPSSYASLTDMQGSYLQVGGGGLTCVLERRDAVDGRQYRAHVDTPRLVHPDGTMLTFGGGAIPLQADEWIPVSLVTEAFIAFLGHATLPPALRWRTILLAT